MKEAENGLCIRERLWRDWQETCDKRRQVDKEQYNLCPLVIALQFEESSNKPPTVERRQFAAACWSICQHQLPGISHTNECSWMVHHSNEDWVGLAKTVCSLVKCFDKSTNFQLPTKISPVMQGKKLNYDLLSGIDIHHCSYMAAGQSFHSVTTDWYKPHLVKTYSAWKIALTS